MSKNKDTERKRISHGELVQMQTEAENKRLLHVTENRCVCCGEIIPEGRMVCPTCERKVMKK